MKYNAGYNSQRNNIDFSGSFPGWKQCMTTCAWMLMCFFAPQLGYNDDKKLSLYFDDVEDSVGKAGIGEWVKLKFNWIKGNTSYWWLTQKYGIEKWLWRSGVKGEAVFEDGVSFDRIKEFLTYGPVMLGTNKIGKLPGGHIILIVGMISDGFIVNDPYGNAMTNYQTTNGREIVYPEDYLRKFAGEKVRCMYWEKS
jgi:hypothetical protein